MNSKQQNNQAIKNLREILSSWLPEETVERIIRQVVAYRW